MSEFQVAEAGIRQLYARYVDAVWRKDHVAFGDCFSEAAEWRISGMVFRGRAEIAGFIQKVFPKYRFILLNFRTPVLTVKAHAAEARAYVSEQSVLVDGKAYGPIGIYYDRLVLQEDQWRYSWRLFHTSYAGPPDLSGAFFENPDFGRPPAMPPLDAPSYDRSGMLTQRSRQERENG